MSERDDPKLRLSDADMLARFQNSKKRPPCSDALGMRLESVDQDAQTLIMSFQVPADFANQTGTIQGGFICAMLDEAMSTCIVVASNVTMNAPTLEMKTSYLRPLFPGAATVKARIVRLGRSVCFMEADCFDPNGDLVARASATGTPKLFKRMV